MLDLYLSHGRRDPAEETPDWGFDGPRLSNVVGIHETYRATLRIIFGDPASAKAAQTLTGWKVWDYCELEAEIAHDMLAAQHEGERAYFGDWGLIRPSANGQHPHAPAGLVSVAVGDLERLRALVEGFHAVKQIRAHAAEENGATKREALALLIAMLPSA